MKKLFKWVGILVGGLVALVVVAAFMADPEARAPAGGVAGTLTTPAAAQTPPLAVSASQLFKDYDDNEVSADQKYKGKRLSVSGSVQSIDKDAFDNIVVTLRTANEFMAVHASLDDKHEQVAASLKKGEKVSWVCEGGGRIIGSPILRRCRPK